jgi:hypothetical protein
MYYSALKGADLNAAKATLPVTALVKKIATARFVQKVAAKKLLPQGCEASL